MISFIIFFLPFVLTQSITSPSACGTPFSWVNITTQDQLIQLSRSSCTFLSGSVALQGPGITDLSPLKNITGIQRSLDITSTGLTTLSGLESLETLGESLLIRSNPVLANLFGINRLKQVDGGVQISQNPKLISIAGLSGLMTINSNQSGSDMSGLSIHSNNALATLTGLHNLTSLGNALILSDLPALTSLDDLPVLKMSVRNLTLSNLSIATLEKLSFLTSHPSAASVKITYMPYIVTLQGLEGFKDVNNFVLMHNGLLADVKAFSNTQFKGPLILVDDNGALCDFTGLKDTAARLSGSQVYDTCGKPTSGSSGNSVPGAPSLPRNDARSKTRTSIMMTGWILMTLLLMQ